MRGTHAISILTLIGLLTVTILGCGQGQSARPKDRVRQGKAEWIEPKPTETHLPELSTTTPEVNTPPKGKPADTTTPETTTPSRGESAPPPTTKAATTEPPTQNTNAEPVNLSTHEFEALVKIARQKPTSPNRIGKDVGILIPPPSYDFEDQSKSPLPQPLVASQVHVHEAATAEPPAQAKSSVAQPTSGKSRLSTNSPTDSTARSTERTLKTQIEQNYLSRKKYEPELITRWIESLRDIDTKTTRSVTYGKQNMRVINFTDESVTFIKVFESLLVTQGRVRVPFYADTGELLSEKEIEVGGDILTVLDGHIFRDQNGAECTKVLCALENILKPQQSEIQTQDAPSSYHAARELLFIYFRYQYILSLQVPKERFVDYRGVLNTSVYELAKRHYEVPSTEMVRAIAKTLWVLPPTMHGMSSLLTFHFVKPYAADPNNKQELGIDYIDHYVGYYLGGSITNSSKTFSGKIVNFGGIVFNTAKFLPLDRLPIIPVHKADKVTKDFILGRDGKIQSESRRMTPAEVALFKPDYREYIEKEAMSSVVHELTHAYDITELVPESELKARGLPTLSERTVFNPGFISISEGWLALSGWTYRGLFSEMRDIEGFSRIPNMIRNSESITRIWDLPQTRGTPPFFNSYAMHSPSEDVAVSTEAYVMYPDLSERHTPQKHNYLNIQIFTFVVNNKMYTWNYQPLPLASDRSHISIRDDHYRKTGQYYDFNLQEMRNSHTYRTSSGVVYTDEKFQTEAEKIVYRFK